MPLGVSPRSPPHPNISIWAAPENRAKGKGSIFADAAARETSAVADGSWKKMSIASLACCLTGEPRWAGGFSQGALWLFRRMG